MVRDSREDFKTYGNVFDNFTNRLLFKLSSQGYFEELQSVVAPGKEANVFTARTQEGYVIVKIYRLESCNFNKMYEYIRNDSRYVGMPKSRRKTIFSWVQREYRNLLKAREHVRVPTPIAHRDHVLVMELIGHNDAVSPLLKDAHPDDPQDFFDKLIHIMRVLWQDAGLVHGDFSEFNIINHEENPVIIDFSQATLKESPGAIELLERDVKNICRFFAKQGVEADEEQVVASIVNQKTP